jgi:hypothetical protein
MMPLSHCVAANPPRWLTAGVGSVCSMPAGTPIETSNTASRKPITAHPHAILGRAEPLLSAMLPIAGAGASLQSP